MPRYVSKEGVWFPAKEKVGLTNQSNKVIKVDGKDVNPGEPFIYEGADRSALYELWKEKQETFGVDFRRNPDFLQMLRDLGFKSAEDYFAFVGYDAEKSQKDFEEKAMKVTSHEIARTVRAIEQLGGGKDFSGQGNDRYGGFGTPDELKGKGVE